jgi:cytochrome c
LSGELLPGAKSMKSSLLCSIVAAFAASSMPALADGDAALGKQVFKKCMACHESVEGKNKVGPHLVGIVGRTAGSAADYVYSDAIKAKNAEGFVWSEENIAAYMKSPKAFIPGIKMAFSGLKKDEDIANLIAYLKADPKP